MSQPSYCVRHSKHLGGVALCFHPQSDAGTCHQCGGIVSPYPSPAPESSHIALGTRIPIRFCDRACADAWDRDHAGYWPEHA